jgi:hypothetical protein
MRILVWIAVTATAVGLALPTAAVAGRARAVRVAHPGSTAKTTSPGHPVPAHGKPVSIDVFMPTVETTAEVAATPAADPNGCADSGVACTDDLGCQSWNGSNCPDPGGDGAADADQADPVSSGGPSAGP